MLGFVGTCLIAGTFLVSACSAHHIQRASTTTPEVLDPAFTGAKRSLNTTSLLHVEIDNGENQSGTNNLQTVPLFPRIINEDEGTTTSIDPKFVQQLLVELEDGNHRIIIVDSVNITN